MTNGNDSIHNSEQGAQDGLTKREYFAAMAMQGLISNSCLNPDKFGYGPYANDAVKFADALINALNQKP